MDEVTPSEKMPLVVLTLVHGTWARGFFWQARFNDIPAPWCRADSSFVTKLLQAFEDEGIPAGYHAMNWSGANSVLDRFEAGSRLAAISRTMEASPDVALHVVIGHSHGGNVAMEALECLNWQKEAPPAIVTIATPFLHMDDKPRLASTPLPGFGTFVLLAAAIFWIIEAGRHTVPFLDFPWMALGSVVLSAAATSWMMIFFFNPPRRSEHLRVWKACSSVPDPNTEILVLRGSEDEAGMALTISSISIRLTDVLTVGYMLVQLVVYRGGWLFAFAAFALLSVAAVADFLLGTSNARQMLSLGAGFTSIAVGVIWILGLFMAARLVLPALAKASFGWELIRGSALLTVSAHSAPDGEAKLVVKTMSRALHEHLTSLHSLYDHADVVPTIVAWAKKVLARRGVEIEKPSDRFPPRAS